MPYTLEPKGRGVGLLAAIGFLHLAACAANPATVYDRGPHVAPPPPPAETRLPASGWFTPDRSLALCRGYAVANPPATDGLGIVVDFTPFAEAAPGLFLARVPVNGACLTSGFGQRSRSFHKGLDLQSQPPRLIHAAADGVVLEAGWVGDYGYQVLIDHGRAVHTRYAHLAGFEPGIEPGARIAFGAPLGMMGATSTERIGIHLHYEVLLGDYRNPRKSFGLAAVSALSLPAPFEPAPPQEAPLVSDASSTTGSGSAMAASG